ncbi:MAG TPA: limonene-1,2-epoxide hydrolase family protein [Dehalococcoidia bacterium]|nr:limonene-1,2-epoxide hydrolase family protein [Dehalococcoidia bacterium]
MATTLDGIAVVRSFCEAWAKRDVPAIMAAFADDAVYHNMPLDPVRGKDAIEATINGFMGPAKSVEFRVLNIAASGNVVLTERIDVFDMGDRKIELPVMGTFELDASGKIVAWRDYFDLGAWTKQTGS